MSKEKAKDKLTEKTKKTGKVRTVFKVLNRIKNVILGIVIVFLVVVLLMSLYARTTGNMPSLFGFSLLRVSTGSMVPELEVGEVVLMQHCDGATVQKDDIVSYNGTEGVMAGKLVTHRVEKAPYEIDGETYLVTRGDANNTSDPPIKASQVEGKMVSKLGFLRAMFDFFATPLGLLTLIGLIILAFFNEIVIFVKALFGIEGKPERSVEEIIEDYQREQLEKARGEEPKTTEATGKTDGEAEASEGMLSEPEE